MNTRKSAVSDIIATAVKMETDGINFYSAASRKVRSTAGRLMFEAFVKDEENHLRVLKEIVNEMFHQSLDEAFASNPASKVKSVFEEKRAMLDKKIEADPGDLETLEIAMSMEDESYRLYKEAGENTQDKDRRALFERLASEEKQHYTLFQNAHTYLSDTGNWFIYEEHGIMDGG